MAVQLQSTLLGLEGQFLSSLIGNQAFCRVMGRYSPSSHAYAISPWVLSLWAGVFGLGQIIGQLVTASLADRWGRRFALYFTLFCVYVGVAVELASGSHNDFTGAKILMGFASGALQAAVPTFVSEVAPSEARGFFIGLAAFALSFGSLVGSLALYAADKRYSEDNLGWRIPLAVGLAAPTVSLVLQLFLLPESPAWLVVRGRMVEARASLAWLYPTLTDRQLDEQLDLLVYTVQREEVKTSFLHCFDQSNRRRTFVSLFPQVAGNFTGTQLVGSYTTYFFEKAGLKSALRSNVIVTCLGLAGTILAFFVVDNKRVGRLTLILVGVIVSSLTMLGVGLIETASHGSISQQAGYGAVFLIALYNFTSSMGPGVAGISYVGESSALRLRAKTAAVALATNVLVGTVCNVVLPYLIDALHMKSGYVFFGFGVVCTVIVVLYIPDLTGRSYAEIDDLFKHT
ncbi:hypothetical protein ASPZODRAFT_135987 [Penicilliopsis zonata CBS 506.65]|uniref:Major facilitator superfamily (MFS) profile domain-containing protein n=1 Tax=Penicilliopsis zonata CBS 506.65 TaxID=1073090 RepID=A0A1L9S8P6_9EURO|nr:hypothetical protein ASPZODRAFT_135987 [Penicilliopsis zonata CBS 506.65]OJJ43529.1 hypothetical protein ASPZODRAFT_135987 [Penicilliopsis zonata CBS 506.65]